MSKKTRSPFAPIREAIDAFRDGRMIIVVDDEDRENEGDLTVAAEKVTPEVINFMAKFGRGPTGEVWRLEEDLAPLLADCRKLLDENSRFIVLTVYAVRMSALAIGELVKQTMEGLGGAVEMGEMAVREEARGLLLPTAIFARWSRS